MIDFPNITLAQIHLFMGNIAKNTQQIIDHTQRAIAENQAEIIVFPEMALLGYPAEDLLWHQGLPDRIDQAIQHLLNALPPEIVVIFGHPAWSDSIGHYHKKIIFNRATVIHHGKIMAQYDKQGLPNYGVFDEKRYFTASNMPCIIEVKNKKLGILICEDIWLAEPALAAKKAGAEGLIVLNASPFDLAKQARRESILRQRIQETNLPIFYVNQVGGQDDLLFDGDSQIWSENGKILAKSNSFTNHLLDFNPKNLSKKNNNPQTEIEILWQGLVSGLRDYVNDNGFPGVLLGMSGGIDSAVVAALAVDALGADRVCGVAMPSQYTAALSNWGAEKQAEYLKIKLHYLPIEPIMAVFLQQLTPLFDNKPADLTEENMQSRCRGLSLMALSNKHGAMVLSTGNKSEMAVGYATLYGDMCGGYAPLKDVYKLQVYELARWRNTQSLVIPVEVIERPPSAELRAEQKDSDSLPEYEILDAILYKFIEQQESIAQIIDSNIAPAEVIKRVVNLVKRAEYKRRQSAPGPKVSMYAFGKERRYPITSGF